MNSKARPVITLSSAVIAALTPGGLALLEGQIAKQGEPAPYSLYALSPYEQQDGSEDSPSSASAAASFSMFVSGGLSRGHVYIHGGSGNVALEIVDHLLT
ncbi:MAG: hypothetical protein JWM91_690 [Rhodospirillales bacterium]|nr:hypothetical protein [Rhodospirillales bacterium]